MKKLRLDLDDLQVESFATEPESMSGGVVGYYGTKQDPTTDCTDLWTCTMPTYDHNCPTAYHTCQNTCANSCHCGTWEYTCDINCNDT